MTGLSYLGLGACHMGDDSAPMFGRAFSMLSRIVHIDLRDNLITDAGATHIVVHTAGLPHLHTIDLHKPSPLCVTAQLQQRRRHRRSSSSAVGARQSCSAGCRAQRGCRHAASGDGVQRRAASRCRRAACSCSSQL